MSTPPSSPLPNTSMAAESSESSATSPLPTHGANPIELLKFYYRMKDAQRAPLYLVHAAGAEGKAADTSELPETAALDIGAEAEAKNLLFWKAFCTLATHIWPEDAYWHCHLGHYLQAQGQIDAARALYQKAYDTAPEIRGSLHYEVPLYAVDTPVRTLHPALLEPFDYIDYAAKVGRSMHIAKHELGGHVGLALELRTRWTDELKAKHIPAVKADIRKLDMPENAVNFCTIMHVLEHMAHLSEVRRVIESAVKVSKNFVYIVGPWFDADAYLAEKGLRCFWSSWVGHDFHCSTRHIAQVCSEMGLKFAFFGKNLARSTQHEIIVPLSAPTQSHQYKAEFGPKETQPLAQPVFEEMICVLIKDEAATQQLLLEHTLKYHHVANHVSVQAEGGLAITLGRMQADYQGIFRQLFESQQWEGAEQAGRRLLEINEANPENHVNLGHVFLKKGNVQWAQGAANTALQLSPGHAGAQALLAQAQ